MATSGCGSSVPRRRAIRVRSVPLVLAVSLRVAACGNSRGTPRLSTILARVTLMLLAVSLGVAACGGSRSAPRLSTASTVAPPSPADLKFVRSAALSTMAGSESVNIDLVAAQVFGTGSTDVQGTGAYDLASGRGHALLKQPAGAETVLFVPQVVYVHEPPGQSNVLPPGKTWMSAPLAQNETVATNFPQFVLQIEDLNPALLLGELAWGSTSAAPLGSRTVNGAKAQGYLVQVDLGRAAAGTSGPAASALSKAYQYEQMALGAGGPGASTPPVELRAWADSKRRVVELEASPPGSGVGTTVFTTSSFGTSVTVSPPLRSQVADVASLTPGGERENNGRGDSDGA